MDKDTVIAVLREHRAELEALGVRHAALFGSLARGEAGPQSDIDIAVDLDEADPPGVFAYVGMTRYVAELFDRPVDVVDRASLHPAIRNNAAADLLYAF